MPTSKTFVKSRPSILIWSATIWAYFTFPKLYAESKHLHILYNLCDYVTEIDTGYILSSREMNSRVLKDVRGYRVSNTMGLQKVGPARARFLITSDMIETTHRTPNHGDTTTNIYTLTTDLQITKEANRTCFPFRRISTGHAPNSFQIRLSTITVDRVYSKCIKNKIVRELSALAGRRLRASCTIWFHSELHPSHLE
jgi:hypothetical protein